MRIYQTISLERDERGPRFTNGVITLWFCADTGALRRVDFMGKAISAASNAPEVELTLDGRYDAATRANVGGVFLHPEDAEISSEAKLLDVHLERGVGDATLTINCELTAGRLEKRYTLRSEGETNVLRRGFALKCARALRLDEAALRLPPLRMERQESLGTHDAHMLRDDCAAALMWAGAYRDECSTVKLEDGALTHRAYLCARCEAGETYRFGEDFLVIEDGANWLSAADCVAREHKRAGLICNNPMRRWFGRMAIYEAMIGEWDIGRRRLTRYARTGDLISDLDRIQGMGFNVVQLMPSMPYPSYTVQDLGDLCLQNAGGEDITPLVRALHERGMRLIMDIVLHGVYDVEASMLRTRQIPPRYARGEYPARHPYRDEHPDWFLHGDDGAIVRTYTWSFDHASEGWQDYVCDSLERYVREYDVDGFRFDALEWSQTPDCAPNQKHSGGAHLRRGNYDLYRKLRERIDPIKPDILWMDENPHIYLTDLMYACYGGDTPFKLEAVRRGECSAHEMQTYLALRSRMFAEGFSIVQYGENHDIAQAKEGVYLTEAHGAPYARLMMAFGAMAGGPFMCFMGGDAGYEDFIRRLIGLRDAYPEAYMDADADFEAAWCEDDRVACIYRAAGGRELLGAFNTSLAPVAAHVTLRGAPVKSEWTDMLTDAKVDAEALVLQGESFILLARERA